MDLQEFAVLKEHWVSQWKHVKWWNNRRSASHSRSIFRGVQCCDANSKPQLIKLLN